MTDTHPSTQIACVYVANLLFQLSLRDLPDDFGLPIVLVDRSDSHAIVMAADQRAARRGVYPGLSYAKAIGLCPNLHATCPHPQKVSQVHKRLISLLGLFSPGVEPVGELFGAYYLDVSGMTRLHPNLCDWGQHLKDALLEREHLNATVVIGFTRFGTRTAAATASGVVLFRTPESELDAAFAAPLKKLDLPTEPLKELEKLNIHTVGDLEAFPDWEVRSRFAEPMFDLVRKSKERNGTVRGIRSPEPYTAQAEFDHTENDAERLIAVIQKLFEPLLERMKVHRQGVSTAHIRLTRDDGGITYEKIQTAKPTSDMTTLTDLLRLRLHAVELSEGVTGLGLHLITGPLPDPQLTLHPALVKSEQTVLKANRAIARIEAEFGTEAIFRAKCRKSHLPEDSFRWEYFDKLRHCIPTKLANAVMMRRFLDQPKRISTPLKTSQQRILGPYSTSGFWWRESSVQRNDYFVETPSGNTLWIFYDKKNGRWYAQGFVQ